MSVRNRVTNMYNKNSNTDIKIGGLIIWHVDKLNCISAATSF